MEIRLIEKFAIIPEYKATSCILILPGRDQYAQELAEAWINPNFNKTVIVGITPKNFQWYPQPFNPLDQNEAVAGLNRARIIIEAMLDRIEDEFNIPRLKTALVGFSAGGVMANYVATHSEFELAGVVCHAGAILEPNEIPQCKFADMPIVLTHCMDDQVFDWNERYRPMKNGLQNKNYNVSFLENQWGNHSLKMSDVQYGATELSDRLGY